MPTRLRAALRARHLHNFGVFCREYDRVARGVDPELVGRHPSRAQFFRWLSGELVGTPYPGHCRVLEAMLPGQTVAELFATETAGSAAVPVRVDDRGPDVLAAYATRAEFGAAWPPAQLLDGALDVLAVGLSLNLIAQNFSDTHLRRLLGDGLHLRCAFLHPGGAAIAAREREEGQPDGVLTDLTRTNLAAMTRTACRLDEATRPRLTLRTYEAVPRLNLLVIDQRLAVVQPYLPGARGIDSPTFVIGPGPAGLLEVYSSLGRELWAGAQPWPPDAR